MNLVGSINYFLILFIDTFRQFGRVRIWLVLLLYFLVNWLLLFSHYRFYSPLFYGLVQPWLNLIDPDNAVGFTHYPGQFLLLPQVFGWTKFYVSILLEGAVLGLVAILFYSSYSGRLLIETLQRKKLFYLWLHLTIAWLVLNGLILLVNQGLPELFESILENAALKAMVFHYLLLPTLRIVILALFFFAIPYIAVYRVSAAKGLIQSLGFLWRQPFTALFLAGLIFIIPTIFSLVLQNQATIVEKFYPEMIYWILLAALGADIFVNFFWMGTAIRFLIDHN